MNRSIRCTYRIQLHKGFTFQQASVLVPYLEKLGVSHLYTSPFFAATPGSLHGYDVCNHNEINPEIGTRDDLERLASELHARNMGLIVDFVPNHMGISDPGNFRWQDVLENGPASPYAAYFDIEWNPIKRALENKVLLPVLGAQYGEVLDAGGLVVVYEDGAFVLLCQGEKLPIATRSTVPVLERVAAVMDSPPDELLSIISAINHLPTRHDASEEDITVRGREKRIIRDRLQKLTQDEPQVSAALEQALAEWNGNHSEENMNRLDALISDQPYRLSYWKVAAEEINYRRFFDINSLAAIQVNQENVFVETHELLLELFQKGILDGVRIDHIDGLASPGEYSQRLRKGIEEAEQAPGSKRLSDRPAIFVEKILGHDEKLPVSWPVEGTTGYEFANAVMNVQVDRQHERLLTRTYERFVGGQQEYREIVHQSKRLIMLLSMASEINMLGTLLSRLAESHRHSRDFTLNALTTAIREVVAAFPIYRTYLDPGHKPTEYEIKIIGFAIAQARRRNPALERSVFEFLRRMLLASDDELDGIDLDMRWQFIRKFQQCTGPIAAKGIEDTAFYRYNRMAALNEVGGEPCFFGESLEEFHKMSRERLNFWPRSMLATSTHDTKRSEDVRARMLVISEVAPQWSKLVSEWRRLNKKHKSIVDGLAAPDANEEYLIYQTLVGTWPIEGLTPDNVAEYMGRIQEYMTKAIREAKVNSSWIDPNEPWDDAVKKFTEKILSLTPSNKFVFSLQKFVENIAPHGALNALSQTIIKVTSPGIPDLYQGTEIWDFSLVDPDNRRPVNYALRSEALDKIGNAGLLLAEWRDGRIKLYVLLKILTFRKQHPLLFSEGGYEAVKIGGNKHQHLIAYMRQNSKMRLLVIVPRLTYGLGFPVTGDVWSDTHLTVPEGTWVDILTSQKVQASDGLVVKDVLRDLPFAVLWNDTVG